MTSVHAWDFSFKGDLSQKTTDNVNSSSTGLVSDKIKNIGAYFQTKDDNDRFRLRFKATRYIKTTENNSNTVEASYQRKFDRDLSDSFQVKFFNEKYTTLPTISGDTNSNNKGGEVQLVLSKPIDKTLSVSGTYLVNYKDYFNSPPRKDFRAETAFGLEKIIKKILTVAPEFNVALNSSKESYYSTFNFGGNIYAAMELSENVEMSVNYSWGKVHYNDRTFTVTKNLRTLTFKEEVTNTSFEAGLNYYPTNWLTLEGKIGSSKSDSNNTSNAYKTTDWSVGASFKY